MADVSAHPPEAMEDVVATNADLESVEPEYVSETLYIQNLNEKIKINGYLIPSLSLNKAETF